MTTATEGKITQVLGPVIDVKFDGALPEGGPVGVALDDGLHDLGQSHAGLFDRLGDRLQWHGRGELRIIGGQFGDPAGEPVGSALGMVNRHEKTSRKIEISNGVGPVASPLIE